MRRVLDTLIYEYQLHLPLLACALGGGILLLFEVMFP